MMCVRIAAVALATLVSVAPDFGRVLGTGSGAGLASTPELPAGASAGGDDQLRRARLLAEEATRHFDELLPTIRSSERIRLAQADQKRPGAPVAPQAADDDFLAPIWEWLERANKQYQSVIVRQLSEGGPAETKSPLATARSPEPKAPAGGPVTAVPTTPPAPPKATGPVIAQPATPKTTPTTPPAPAAQPQAPAGQPQTPVAKAPVPTAPPAAADKDIIDTVQEAVQTWIDRASRDYQAVIVRRLADPATGEPAFPTAKGPAATSPTTVAQVPPAAPRAGIEEAARLAEQQKRDADARRLVEVAEAEKRAAAEAAAKSKSEADKRIADAAAKSDAERKAAEAKRATEGAEAKRVADAAAAKAEADRKAAEAAKAEADRKAAEAKRAVDAAEAKRVADAAEAKRIADAAEAKRVADAKAAADRKAAEDAKRVADAKAAADRRAAEEAKRVADAKAAADRKAEAQRVAQATKADAARSETKEARPAASDATRTADSTKVAAATVRRTSKRRVAVAGYSTRDRASLGAAEVSRLSKRAKRERQDRCERRAGLKVRPGESYIAKPGDTLWRIAELHYGHGNRFGLLHNANASQIGDPNWIWPCQVIVVPRSSGASS